MSTPGRRVVALDGPSGSGKSTVAKGVAQALGWRYVDTGATYRAATLAVLRAGADPRDADVVARVVVDLVRRGDLQVGTQPDGPAVHLRGEDVSAAVRAADVTAAVSAVSAVPEVRRVLVDLQRAAMGDQGAVAEGRDIASVVAPEAAVKVYLDADPEVRARRRAGDHDAGVATSEGRDVLQSVAADLARRDRLDSSRATSPLQVADDAAHIDASALSAEQVVAAVLALVAETGLRPA